MDKRQIVIEGAPELLEQLQAEQQNADIQISAVTNKRSPANIIDAPIGGEMVAAFADITVILKTASAAMSFVVALIKLVRASKTPVIVKDAKSGTTLLAVDENTSEEEVKRQLKLES